MKTRTMRLSNEQVEALTALAQALGVEGQRGARLQPFIQWLAGVATAAWPETVAALRIAEASSGGDWHELIEAITPQYSE